MKKVLCLILCGVLILVVTGCGTNEVSSKKNDKENVQESGTGEISSGSLVVICKGKSNDFANILENMVSATRIEKYVVEDNVIIDFQVNIEVELNKKYYSKNDVDGLVKTEKYSGFVTTKKNDYVLNFEQENESHGFTWESDNMVSEITKIKEGASYGYTCEVE